MFSLLDDSDYYVDMNTILPIIMLQNSLENKQQAVQNHVRRRDRKETNTRPRVSQHGLAKLLGELMNLQAQNDQRELAEEKNKYKLMLDVQQFSPNEISVKVIDDFVVVEGCHEDKEDDHGWISRKFTRRYQIPKEWDIDQLTSKLSSDGVLTILAPPKHQPQASGERVINIQHTGKPAVHQQPQEKKEIKSQ